MPIISKERDITKTEKYSIYICDGCGKEFDDDYWSCNGMCGRIYCDDCKPKHLKSKPECEPPEFPYYCKHCLEIGGGLLEKALYHSSERDKLMKEFWRLTEPSPNGTEGE